MTDDPVSSFVLYCAPDISKAIMSEWTLSLKRDGGTGPSTMWDWRNGLEQTCATPGSVPVTAAGLFSPATQAFEPQFAGKSLTAVRCARE
jgi:hypothetical protein